MTNQDTNVSIDAPPCTQPEISECAQDTPGIVVSHDSLTENRSSLHKNSYLFDNIYHLMHLSRAKRDPHVRRRHKHLLFEKHDIHLHPHFFHKLVVVNFINKICDYSPIRILANSDFFMHQLILICYIPLTYQLQSHGLLDLA